MAELAVSIDNVWKQFRLYHDKNQYLKTAILKGGRARYEEFWALQGVSFDIPTGSTFGIIGSNGSGKSTLLKCLAGILTPDEGTIAVHGRIAALLELGAGFHPELSGRENIFLNGAILGMSTRDIHNNLDSIIEFAGLGTFIDTPVKNYSSGMVVRLGFAIAINVDPEILIIDEILAVGDTAFQQKCLEKIEDFRKDGRTIILVSHGLSDVSRICDTVAWIEKGLLKEVGPAFQVVDNYSQQSHDAKTPVAGEIGKRWGSGEISISEIQLYGAEGEATDIFTTGQSILIRVGYLSHISLANCCVDVKITHLHGTEIWSTSNERQAVTLPIKDGVGYIQVEIPELSLLDGTYELSVSISDHGGIHEFDHWEKSLRFDVLQRQKTDSGLIRLPTSWQIS